MNIRRAFAGGFEIAKSSRRTQHREVKEALEKEGFRFSRVNHLGHSYWRNGDIEICASGSNDPRAVKNSVATARRAKRGAATRPIQHMPTQQKELIPIHKAEARRILERSRTESMPLTLYDQGRFSQWFCGYSVNTAHTFPKPIGDWLVEKGYLLPGIQDVQQPRKTMHVCSEAGRKWLDSFPKAAPVFECPECKAPFDSASKLGSHRFQAHGIAGNPAKKSGGIVADDAGRCPHCPATFKYKGALDRHIASKHRPVTSAHATNGHALLKPELIGFQDESPEREEVIPDQRREVATVVVRSANAREARIAALLEGLPDAAVEAIIEYGIIAYQDDIRKRRTSLERELKESDAIFERLSKTIKEK